jgi:hypothetical protein
MSQVSSNTTPATPASEPIKSVLQDKSLEKWVPVIKTQEDLFDVVEKAVDYRGDITITLKDSTKIVCYVYNKDVKAAEPFIEVFPSDKDEKRRILYKDIDSVAFTGIDTAAGKSWAVWMAKYKAKEEASNGSTGAH